MKIDDSSRLSYKLMSADDAPLLFELDQDPEVMRFINRGKMTSKEDINSVFIPRMEKYRNPTQGWGLWQVNIAETMQFIGWILVRPMEFFSGNPELDNLELGWRFKRSSWGKGYASEAAIHIKDCLSTSKEVKNFSAIAVEDNFASIAVMKKLGMSYVKTYLHKDPLGDLTAVYYQIKNT
mgnify:CR=1 FL=1